MSLILVATLIGTNFPVSAAPEPERTALVRIDLAPSADLSELAGTGVMVYARLYTADGGLALLLGVDALQRDSLRRRGYRLQVINLDADQAGYYLLYGLPEALAQLGQAIPLLVLEGRQAVARLNPEQLLQAEALGIGSLPLHPQPLTVPRPEAAEALAIPAVVTPDPLVQEMINQVSSTALYNLVGDLSGEWPITVNGGQVGLPTRYTLTTDYIRNATIYVRDRFTSMGLPADYHFYNLYGYTKRNVHAWQTGLTSPERQFLITAHLDSYSSQSPYTLAPGADDNASGSAGVLAVANILRQYLFGCTLRYVLFTGEEQGLYGSAAFAQEIANLPNINVEAVLNLDMIAYNTTNSAPTMDLHIRTGNASDLVIANLFKDVVTAYHLNLTPNIIQPGNTFSDHSNFWNLGIPAILAIEDWSDHTPSYHSTTDQLGTLNMAYFTQITKAAVGTLAHMGCLLTEGELHGFVKNASDGSPVAGAMVIARLDATHFWTTTVQPDGRYQMLIPPGVYTVELSADANFNGGATGIQVERAKATNLDIAACKAANFTQIPFLPDIGQTVTFTANITGLPASAYHWNFGDGSVGSGEVVTHSYPTSGVNLVTLAIDGLCAPATASHLVAVRLPAYFFPLAPAPQR